jgi:hypothetical protein
MPLYHVWSAVASMTGGLTKPCVQGCAPTHNIICASENYHLYADLGVKSTRDWWVEKLTLEVRWNVLVLRGEEENGQGLFTT